MNQKRASLGRKYPIYSTPQEACTCSVVFFSFISREFLFLQTVGSCRNQGPKRKGLLSPGLAQYVGVWITGSQGSRMCCRRHHMAEGC
jgi:hypothetical protein